MIAAGLNISKLLAVTILVLQCSLIFGQENKNPQGIIKDTLDGKLDMSRFLLEANGFIPVPQLITEPAFGYLGIVVAEVFIKPNKHRSEKGYTPPDVTAAYQGITVNGTWMLGALRSASIPRYGLKYRVSGGYANVNLDFYRDIPVVGEVKFPFNFQTVPLFGTVIKKVGNTNIYAGFQYLFMATVVTPEFEFNKLPDFIEDKSFNTIQSGPGVLVEYDGRDNIFTPDKGTLVNLSYRINAKWTGSDFEFQNIKGHIFQYFQLTNNWVSGFKFETQQQLGDAPFYLEPGLDMRGVPSARYQGTSTYMLCTEQRYDFSLRWSGVAFGGTAKAVSQQESFADSELVYNYGLGFRYLIARAFKIRMGIDLAMSNENFGYYVVFGSFW